jgi:hypothetical protein
LREPLSNDTNQFPLITTTILRRAQKTSHHRTSHALQPANSVT